MAKEDFRVGVAFGVQSAFGTANATIAALAGSLATADGIVLGHREAGDAESGITLPSFVRVESEKPDVAASFTKQFPDLLRHEPQGFAIAVPMKGNGVTSTPSAGQAAPLAGIDALLQMSGLIGANGTNPIRSFTPRHAGSSGGSTIYGTAKLWIDDLSYVISDLLVESFEIELTPGGLAIATFNLTVGTYDPATGRVEAVTFPTFNYGTMETLSAPRVVGVAHTWGQSRGFESMTVSIENEVESFQDSNLTTGRGQSQTGRTVSVEARIFVDDTNDGYDFDAIERTTAPTDDMTMQIGTVAAPAATINAFGITVNNVHPNSVKRTREGQYLIDEISASGTATTAGGEFTLSFN